MSPRQRRRARRYVMAECPTAHVCLLQDVVVESLSADRATLIARTPAGRNEELVIEIGVVSGEVRTFGGTVIASVPLLRPDDAGVRLQIRLHGEPPQSGDAHALGAASTSQPGTVMRSHQVRVRDISAAGCLLLAPVRLPIDAVGLLQIDIDGRRRVEAFRVCRVRAADDTGATVQDAGVEFLPLAPPDVRTIRGAMLRVEHARASRAGPSGDGTFSGQALTSDTVLDPRSEERADTKR